MINIKNRFSPLTLYLFKFAGSYSTCQLISCSEETGFHEIITSDKENTLNKQKNENKMNKTKWTTWQHFSIAILFSFSTGLCAQNNALDFDGSNDYITVSYNSSHDMNTTLTIEAWVYPTDTGWNSIIMKGNYGYGFAMSGGTVGGTANNCGGAASSSGRKLVFWDQNSCSSSIYSTDTYSLNTWQHVVITVEDVGSTLTINFYIDGELDGPYTSNQTAISNGGSSKELYIGDQGECLCNYHQGKIDEVRIWDDVRTQAEIKANMYTELSGSESNLVAYYKLNESSGTTASDETSNSNDGTLTNMDGSTDWVSVPLFAQNTALDFDGTNDYVDCGNSSLGGSFTVSCWVKPGSIATDWAGFVSKNVTSGQKVFWLGQHLSGGYIRFGVYLDGNTETSLDTDSAVIANGNWYHIAASYDGNYQKIYVNGVLVKTSTDLNTAQQAGTSNYWIGKSTGAYFNGKIDEVRIWDDVRTQAEIKSNMYTELSGSESNLVAYYNMNAGRGTSLLDLTTNNNSGTLTNMDGSTDWVSGFELGVSISGTSGFRMMSSPVAGQIYSDLLAELWTQGMTSADVTSGDANVWTYDGSSWSALSDITGSGSGASLTAGQGFLVYVFADTDNDGTDDLPVTLSVSGTENSSSATVPSSGSIADAAWELAGNPYASTIDWDLVTQTAVTTSCYVWDDATSAYKTWNGSSGGLTDGLIAPYQGFWVKGSGGTGSITIETADKSSTAGTFYKTMNDSTGSMIFSITSGDYSDETYVSFMTNGEESIDNSDAYKLLPMTPTDRLVGLSYAEGSGLDINNLPYAYEGSISIPLDVMSLTVDDNYNFVTNENNVTMSWDISSVPESIIGLTLTDNTTNATTDLLQSEEMTFTTTAKGSFPAYGSGGVNIYPEVGESQFTLTIHYSVLSSEDGSTIPTEYALHQAYPNPFNPSTTITFDVPAETGHALSLQIFNVKGQLVETLINEHMEPGTHKAEWNPRNLSSGLYIVQMKAGDKTFIQKITFIK